MSPCGSSFTAAVSEFTRSQLYRWSDHADWSKIHVVRCGLDGTFLDVGPCAIPEARRAAVPGVRLCLACQEGRDRDAEQFSLYNRRGSKDSQLR